MADTKKLYDQDAYATEFDGVVLSCEEYKEKENVVYRVILDQTVFFPEEGGQSPDKGMINGIEVTDVQIKNNCITHTLQAPLKVGQTVHGQIDWNHRFNNMQQHSGEHIFSGLVHQKYGYNNVGFHLSNQIVTLDFDGVLTWQQASEIERQANDVIINNIPIQVTYPTKEELSKMEYRSKIEIEGQVRIVTIPGVDVCACCAPHVRYTGKIGMVKMLTLQNYKGGVRISILCGFRALNDYREKVEVITNLSSLMSSNQEKLAEAVTRLKDVNSQLKLELNTAKKEYMEAKIAQIPENQENAILFEKNLDAATMRNAVNTLVSRHSGICGVFSDNGNESYQFILGSGEQDVRKVMEQLKVQCNARGGGSAAMVQGSVSEKQDNILEALSIVTV